MLEFSTPKSNAEQRSVRRCPAPPWPVRHCELQATDENESVLYFQARRRRFTRFMDFDMNWWGVLAFPVGTLICFGPVLVAWAMTYRSDSAPRDRKNRR
jgi:hypothetical protein